MGASRIGAFAVLVATMIGGCRRPPPRVVRSRVTPLLFEVRGPARWLDRDAGVVELHVLCFKRRVDTLCSQGECTERPARIEQRCPGTTLELTGPSNDQASAVVDDEYVRFTVAGLTAPPAPTDGWTVAIEGAEIAWHLDAIVAALAPPSSVESVPRPRPQRSYAGWMMLVDLLILATAYPVIALAHYRADSGELAGGVYYAGIVSAGALVHHRNGNRWQAGASLARRLLVPAAFAFGPALLLCSSPTNCRDDLALGAALLGIAGATVSWVVVIVYDWVRARVTLPPVAPYVAPVERGGGVVGLGVTF